MKNNLKKNLASFSAKILKASALKTSASVCCSGLYQPKEPKCLREK